jgi:hypothetical protein
METLFYSPREPPPKMERYLGDEIFAGLTEVDYADSRVAKFREGGRVKPQIASTIPANELFWGWTDRECMIPMTIPFFKMSMSIVMLMEAGAGKTQAMKMLADQLHTRWNYRILFVDIKNDYDNLNEPQNDPVLIERLKKVGLAPKSIRAKRLKNVALGLANDKGIPYLTTMKSIAKLGQGKASQTIKQIITTMNNNKKTEMGVDFVLSQGIPETIEEFAKAAQGWRKFQLQSREEVGYSNPNVSVGLDVAIKTLNRMHIIGDDGEEMETGKDELGNPIIEEVYGVDFAQELMNRNNDAVVLAADLSLDEKAQISSCMLKVAIASPWEDRMTWMNSNHNVGIMSEPFALFMDEAEKLVPKKSVPSASRDEVVEIRTKGRQFGCISVACTQDFNKLNTDYWNNANIVVISRLTHPKLEAALATKFPALTESDFFTLKNLYFDLNNPPQEVAIITQDTKKPVRTCYLCPPCTRIKKENE